MEWNKVREVTALMPAFRRRRFRPPDPPLRRDIRRRHPGGTGRISCIYLYVLFLYLGSIHRLNFTARYHVSAPPAGTPGPFPTRYYDRSVSNNFVEIRGRSSTATNHTTASRHSPRTSSALATSSASSNTLSRSRSAQSLKMQAEAAAAAAVAEGCQVPYALL